MAHSSPAFAFPDRNEPQVLSAAGEVQRLIAAGETVSRAHLNRVLNRQFGESDADGRWSVRDAHAVLELAESEATLALYPFRFRLRIIYEITDGRLSVTARVGNPGDETLPCGIGAHPAFIWPLVEGVPKDRHIVEFGAQERGEMRSVTGGLIGPAMQLPGDGRRIELSEELFRNDALVIPDVVSNSLRFVALDEAGEHATDVSGSVMPAALYEGTRALVMSRIGEVAAGRESGETPVMTAAPLPVRRSPIRRCSR